MSLPYLTREEDDFTFEKPRWLAYLSNGEKIIQDDNRPGVEPASAWLRLRDYCRQTGAHVVELKLQFRSHHEAPLPTHAEGYYFCNRVSAVWGSEESCHFFVIGVLVNNNIFVQHWKVPELILIQEEVRPADHLDERLLRRTND